jgi:hypothetical protein
MSSWKALDARTTDATHDAIANSQETKLTDAGYRTWVPWAFRCHLYDREAKSIGQKLSAHGRKIKKILETRDVAKWTFGNGGRAAILERKMRTNFGGRDRR